MPEKILLIDGAQYNEWTDLKEPEDLEPMVVEHSDDIFGEDSIYLDKKYKLKTITGVGSIPDGFAIIFSNQPEWHIVEVELSSHDIYEHVVKQVTKFMDGIENLNSKDNLFEAIWNSIDSDYLLKHKLEKASGTSNPHWFLSNLIKKSTPIITLIIEKEQLGLEGTLSKFTYLPHKIVEFRTFRREGAETVHAHLFEPLHIPKVTTVPERREAVTSQDTLEVPIRIESNIKWHYLEIPVDKRSFFPADKVRFTVETDMGEIETTVAGTGSPFYGPYIQRSLKGWFDAHPQLKKGAMIHISVIEQMKKYSLEIVK